MSGCEKCKTLDDALAAAVSCHQVGTDSACLECQACERYDAHTTQRRFAQVQAELERIASERDTARELARDAIKARDQALACEAAANGLLSEWATRVSAAETHAAFLQRELQRAAGPLDSCPMHDLPMKPRLWRCDTCQALRDAKDLRDRLCRDATLGPDRSCTLPSGHEGPWHDNGAACWPVEG